MAGVDIDTFHFDFDLTFAALLMNADGTIYHTYGGRDWTDPQSHLSVKAFVDVLARTVSEHEAYEADPDPPRRARKRTIEQLPAMQARIDAGKAPKCFHCHMVHDMLHEERRKRGAWRRQDIWIWPDPVEVGLRLDKDEQVLVREVVAASPAAKAGLRRGDRLLDVDGRRVRTFGDVQRALHEASPGRATLRVRWSRGAEPVSATLRLPARWKEADPLVFSWRPSKWPLSPKPGFGGRRLEADALRDLGLSPDAFAFRVGYVVTWGPNAHTGRNARKAGIRKGDVVTSVAGKSDFESVDHFHAWFRLTQKPGTKVAIERIRGGQRETLTMDVVD